MELDGIAQMADDTLKDAIYLIKTGKKADAKKILEPFIMANPKNLQAWFWETETEETIAGKIKLMEMCLRHNPDEPQVIKALAVLIAHQELARQEQQAKTNIQNGFPSEYLQAQATRGSKHYLDKFFERAETLKSVSAQEQVSEKETIPQTITSSRNPDQSKKRDLVVQITDIEMKISQAQENINTFNKQIDAAVKGQGNAGLMVFLGLLFAPVGIGIIAMIAGFIVMITVPGKVKKLKEKRDKWLVYLKGLKKKLIYLRGELAMI